MRRLAAFALLCACPCACSTSPAPDQKAAGLLGADASGDGKVTDVQFADVAHPDSQGADATQDATPTQDATADAGAWTSLVAKRPYQVKVPAQYDAAQPWPLLLLLHGYAESSAFIDGWMHLGDHVSDQGYLLAIPDGTVDATGMRFWNADDACCDVYATGVDDVTYLKAVLSDMAAKYHVDPQRIYVMGHSNGAFMAHRLACEAADQVAAIVAVSGDAWKDGSKCKPSRPVAVLQVHGTLDAVISYLGGILPGGVYPSAQDSVAGWGQRGGCATTPDTSATLDLDGLILGKETIISRWTGCQAGGGAELWTVQGASHFPSLQGGWAKTSFGWLQAHSR
jgi:polyhydroxybutyrate depolymerase